MSLRKFALGKYDGQRVYLPNLKRAAERKALVGKRIGYDLRSSSMMHFGRVTGTIGKALEIDGSVRDLHELEQVVILNDQGSPDDNAQP